MNLKSLNNVFLILFFLSVILLPFAAGATIIGLSEEDNFANQDNFMIINNISVTWVSIPVHQMPILLGLGISIFTLFIVYLGGRSKHRRFNDRTIAAVNVLKADFLKAARIRAAFNFPFFAPIPQEVRSNLCR